jgi:predicted nucleic acid-binding protein
LRVFPDTNVLASAFGTRGLCADVLRLILREHELVTGEVVLEELRGVSRRKFGVPAKAVTEIESFLRGYQVQRKPHELPGLKLGERSAGDRLGAQGRGRNPGYRGPGNARPGRKPEGLQIVSPREFWNLAAGRGKGRV